MRVLVCGGRDYNDFDCVWDTLTALHQNDGPITCIIHGAAIGADTLGRQWAEANNIPHIPFPADWKRYDKMAGRVRNGQMLREGKPDLVVAFPGEDGTANMMKQARDAKVTVIQVSR